ncbi:hypothetical protein [Thioalkalivibrio paradoxus]|uniref:hypothetical protein n=1 Tax=Thioalkalivibrio paradoxus TaxID=108010 RepID=UPI00046D92CC|nr:hypothetical protein [Thioalkalivibrio paradoxus]
MADVVALKRKGQELCVRVVQDKHSASDKPGAGIDDFYPACGQAQESVHWREKLRRLLKHLFHQEDLRLKASGASRFERGSRRDVQQLAQCLPRTELRLPGRDRAAGPVQSEDRAGRPRSARGTETFLQETFSMPLDVIASG